MNLDAQIEAVLFYKAEPVKKTTLAEILSVSVTDIEQGLVTLSETLAQRGIALACTQSTAQLVTNPSVSTLIEQVRKDELKSDIGRAGAETLAIILYKGPLSRIEIDKIRGVNSAFIIRNLLIRGLVERKTHPTDSRSFIYAITPALLNHLGISAREALPEFAEIMTSLDQFEKEQAEDVSESNPLVAE